MDWMGCVRHLFVPTLSWKSKTLFLQIQLYHVQFPPLLPPGVTCLSARRCHGRRYGLRRASRLIWIMIIVVVAQDLLFSVPHSLFQRKYEG